MIIGITGNSGAGKTTASVILANEINAKIINADEIVKKSQKKGMPYYNEIIKKMGQDILQKDLEIDRKKLAQKIYDDKEKRDILNKITEKYIVEEIKKQIQEVKQKDIILDIPLLFESGLDKICDETISILADEKIKIQRISIRENIDENVAKKRLEIQPEEYYYKSKSNYIIENNGDDLSKNIKKVWEKICLKHGTS